MPVLEICCFDTESLTIAAKGGADRIELCQDREEGGITPPLQDVQLAVSQMRCPIFVMIRPRGGDFVFSENEFEIMKTTVVELRDQVAGFVFGCLMADRTVDITRTSELVRLATGAPCTFHRAFDEVPEPFEALEAVIVSGCSTILTSGTAASAAEGTTLLFQLIEAARGRVEIMPGGGVRVDNLAQLRRLTRATSFHSSGIPTGMDYPSFEEIRKMRDIVHGT